MPCSESNKNRNRESESYLKNRKGPLESACDFEIGYEKKGQDGTMYKVIKAGKSQRWSKVGKNPSVASSEGSIKSVGKASGSKASVDKKKANDSGKKKASGSKANGSKASVGKTSVGGKRANSQGSKASTNKKAPSITVAPRGKLISIGITDMVALKNKLDAKFIPLIKADKKKALTFSFAKRLLTAYYPITRWYHAALYTVVPESFNKLWSTHLNRDGVDDDKESDRANLFSSSMEKLDAKLDDRSFNIDYNVFYGWWAMCFSEKQRRKTEKNKKSFPGYSSWMKDLKKGTTTVPIANYNTGKDGQLVDAFLHMMVDAGKRTKKPQGSQASQAGKKQKDGWVVVMTTRLNSGSNATVQRKTSLIKNCNSSIEALNAALAKLTGKQDVIIRNGKSMKDITMRAPLTGIVARVINTNGTKKRQLVNVVNSKRKNDVEFYRAAYKYFIKRRDLFETYMGKTQAEKILATDERYVKKISQ